MPKEQGSTGLLVFTGQVQEEFLRELRGREGYKRYDEMRRNSPVIGAMLYYHEMSVRKVSWNFSNTAGDETDERVYFLNATRERMTQSWNEFISEVLSFMAFGYSIFWTNYKRDPKTNGLGWDSFSPRKQNTVYQWLLNYPGVQGYDPNRRNGEIMGFIQQAPPTYTMTTLPVERLLHFRTRIENNNPEGMSLLRNAWVPYYYAKNLQSVEAIGYERDLNGLPRVTMPQGADANPDDANSDFSKAAEMVRNVRVDEQGGAVVPFGWTFDLLSASGKGFADIGHAIERYESRMLMAMLSQFIMLGQNGVGSLALSKDSTSVAEMIVNATADIIAETFTKQEIPRILKLNGYAPDDIVLEHSPAGDSDLTMFADFIQKVGDKLTWDASDEVWLRQLGGLPEKTEETIAQAMEEAEVRADEARRQFIERARMKQNPNGSQSVKDADMKDEMEDDMKVTVFAGVPLAERKRRQIEKQWNEAMSLFLAKQKRRVLKSAREMKAV
jgi:hypothetical protein